MERRSSRKRVPLPRVRHTHLPIRKFNLMFKTYIWASPRTAPRVVPASRDGTGNFRQTKNVLRTTRKKLPFGIGQISKSFRNEITPGNFIFRTREFTDEFRFFLPGWH